MKNLFFLLCAFFAISASAQHTGPRWGTSPNSDNTFRAQKLGYRVVADVAQAAIDSITLNPNSLQSHVALTVSDSCVIYANPTSAWYGDRLTININNTAGANHIVRFSGRGAVATPFQFGSGGASIALTTSKRANIQFMFDGTAWVEISRLVQ